MEEDSFEEDENEEDEEAINMLQLVKANNLDATKRPKKHKKGSSPSHGSKKMKEDHCSLKSGSRGSKQDSRPQSKSNSRPNSSRRRGVYD
jgi:hypothetical protein